MSWKEIANLKLKIYSAPWCSDCRRLKKRLDECNVNYTEVDIDNNSAAIDYLVKKTGHKAIPYIEIGGKWMIRGWHKEKPSRWDDTTFFSEVEAAMAEG